MTTAAEDILATALERTDAHRLPSQQSAVAVEEWVNRTLATRAELAVLATHILDLLIEEANKS